MPMKLHQDRAGLKPQRMAMSSAAVNIFAPSSGLDTAPTGLTEA
jgi:hypothetical protein